MTIEQRVFAELTRLGYHQHAVQQIVDELSQKGLLMELNNYKNRCCDECGKTVEPRVKFASLEGNVYVCQSCLSEALDLFEHRIPGEFKEKVFASGIAESHSSTVLQELSETLLPGSIVDSFYEESRQRLVYTLKHKGKIASRVIFVPCDSNINAKDLIVDMARELKEDSINV